MPYKTMDEVNPSLKGIKPALTLAQCNMVAGWADKIQQPPEKSWPFAIAAFKKAYQVKGEAWVKKSGESDGEEATPDFSEAALAELEKLVEASAMTKSVGGEDLPATDFLVVEDPKSPTTWHLAVAKKGVPDRALAGAAWAALFAAKGFRGNKYSGPNKADAQKKLKDYYDKQGWPQPSSEAEEAETATLSEQYGVDAIGGYPQGYVPYGVTSFAQLEAMDKSQEMADELRERTSQFTKILANIIGSWSVSPDLVKNGMAALWVEFQQIMDKILSGQNTQEGATTAEAAPAGTPDTLQFAESFEGGVEVLEEGEAAATENPLKLKVQIIRPGWGNTRDNNYYPKEMLARDSGKFVGAKMYESDHKDQEKSTRTWVSTIKAISGFTSDGAPVAEVLVHDPSFASRIRNLSKGGLLDKMECSILASGVSKPGFELGERKGRVVESIADVVSVDWVTKAGAGGRALEIAEAGVSTETPATDAVDTPLVRAPAAPVAAPADAPALAAETGAPAAALTALTEVEVKAKLSGTRLPQAAKDKLGQGSYKTAEELEKAVLAEIAYLKAATGSGKVSGMAEASRTAQASLEEINRRKDAVNKKYLGGS